MDNFTVYLHGVPGSPAELNLFGLPIFVPDFAPNRFGGAFGSIKAMAEVITRKSGGAPVHLVAFSLGSRIALELAAVLGDHVALIDLIAPAAPLEAGDFLPDMAGQSVFTTARDRPAAFGWLVAAQRMASVIAPTMLATALLKGAAGGDAPMAAQRQFRRQIGVILGTTLADGGVSYRREITAYAMPWTDLCRTTTAPTRIYYGTSDTWAPPAMALWLAGAMPFVSAVTPCDQLSHYSTLQAALHAVAAQITRLQT